MLSFGIFDWRADWLIYLLLPVATLVGTMGGAWLHHHVDVNAVLLVLQGLVLLSTVSLTDATSGSAFGNAMLVAYALVGCAIAAFIVFLTSMNYRFLRKRPTLAPLWAARKQRKKAVAQAAKALATQQPMVPNADGSVSTQADSH
jgi:Zn-dependent protease with chaperone function